MCPERRGQWAEWLPPAPGLSPLPGLVPSSSPGSGCAWAASLLLSCLFMPQRSSSFSRRLHFWSRWTLWCPCWTALTSKVPSGVASPLLYMGRSVDGQDFSGFRLALLLVFTLVSTLRVLATCTGIKIARAESSASELGQFGPKDTQVSPVASHSRIPSVFYPTPQHLSFRVLQGPGFTVRVPVGAGCVCVYV